MNMEQLNSKQVTKLINETKYFLKSTKIAVPRLGKYKKDITVYGEGSNIGYRFHAYRGNIICKYSIHLRFAGNDLHLIRLCINGNRHHNEDGTSVGSDHIHIYTFHDNHVESYAYDLNNFPFSGKDDLATAIDEFLEYLHISEREARQND